MKRKTQSLREALLGGLVIPAHPLALTAERKLDERHQQALTRYYCASGAGGVAVAVHTTQFQIREPAIGLLKPVLELAAAVVDAHEQPLLKVAGVCGPTPQAIGEAVLARDLGYDVGLLSLGALGKATTGELVAHCTRVAEELPLLGFYLQPAVGGRVLDYGFWRRFLEIEDGVGIKVAPFDRYKTADVARAVEMLEAVKRCRAQQGAGALELLTLGQKLTDANAALFDSRNAYHGCIAGIHEALRRQGLLRGLWCLDPKEGLSPGQLDEIDRVHATHPELRDDAFVAANLDAWLR